MDLKDLVRTIPDYPQKGSCSATSPRCCRMPAAFRQAVDELVQPYAGTKIDKIVGIEARGFILGGAVSHQLGRLRADPQEGQAAGGDRGHDYELEYGTDRIEMHTDAMPRASRSWWSTT
jgi:adenine phosphoribosyltransferase